ncbi:MAG: enoyl-CoA hydratase/isomerase family protein [Lautropia sp.]
MRDTIPADNAVAARPSAAGPVLHRVVTDRVALLTMSRPHRMNALNDELVAHLKEAISSLSADPAVGAVLLTGAGRAFCAGADTQGLASGLGNAPLERRVEVLRARHDLVLAIRRSPKIFIAMINGPAIGSGMGLALACDFRYAGRSSYFLAGFARIAGSGDFGATWALPRLVGPEWARRMLFCDHRIDADVAQQIGLVSKACSDEDLLQDSMAFARRLASGPGVSQGLMKRNLLCSESASLSDTLDLEATHQARASMTGDHREGIAALMEKRAPRFSGS